MPIMIELPSLETQHPLNQRRWAELLSDTSLATIPGRVETDRYGHIIMSPPAHPDHGGKQSEIAICLRFIFRTGV